MSLPDARIKQSKKLLGLVNAWMDTEREWVQAEMALDNLEEQLKAVAGNCKEFNQICTTALGQDKGLEVLCRLVDKIKSAITRTSKMQDDILTELESQQKKFYGHRLETEKSLQGKHDVGNILSHFHSRAYKWDEVVRWTVQLHIGLCASIEAKKAKLPFDPPALVDDVLERLDCLNYM